jgi:hypothetical protein
MVSSVPSSGISITRAASAEHERTLRARNLEATAGIEQARHWRRLASASGNIIASAW